jgi:hypothetical protein
MASFTNFLTQGQPLPSSSSSLTTSQVPQYLSDYLYNLMNGAYSAAQQPYQAYNNPDGTPAPRIAGFTDPQTKAFGMTETSAGAYQPQLNAAEKTATNAGGLNTLGAAQPYFNAASASTPGVIQNYMNPYQQNVIEQMGTQAQRQLQEKILPAIGDQFTRAGQFGSSRQQEIAQRGVRDIASGLEQNIGTQLAQGYTTAGQQAQADLSRLASMGQAAGTLTGTEEANKAALAGVQAGLGQKEQALGLTGAAATEAVGAEQQAMNQKNLDLAYQDFQNQTAYPEQQLGFLSNIVRGLPSGGSTTSGTTSSIGGTYSASPLASLASAGLSAAALSNLLKGP